MADVEDGTFDFSLGQDAWHNPDHIQPNQYVSAVNVTTLGGQLTPRPPFQELELNFEEKLFTNKLGRERTIKDIFQAGKFQALIPYKLAPEDYLIVVVSGLIFRVNIRTGNVILLSEDIIVDQYAPRINWSYAGGSIVIFDYPDYPVVIGNADAIRTQIDHPIIVGGSTVFRASPNHTINGQPAPQVPISNMGTYNQNRLFVANAGVEFTAGDPVGSLATPEAPVTFTEVFNPSSPYINQFFSLPVEFAVSPITAMGFIQELDSSTGVGPLFISSSEKVFFFKSNQPRAQWGAQDQFGGVLLANAGIAGPRAFVNINSDLLFLSSQGQVHAFSNARNEAKKWGNVPVSREVDNYLKFKDPFLRQFAVLGYFDNRIFISTNPYRIQSLDREQQPVTDYAHAGFVVLEIENLASFLSDGAPVWAGLWTGIDPMDIATLSDRCFAISKDTCGKFGGVNTIYEFKKNERVDIARGVRRRIRSILYTRLYDFQSAFAQKREGTVTLHLQDLEGRVNLEIEKRPTHSVSWLPYATWKHEAPVEECATPDDTLLNGLASQQLKHVIYGDGSGDGTTQCNPITKDLYNVFRAVQLRITIEGDHWLLDDIKLKAQLVPFVERGGNDEVCDPLPIVKQSIDCDPDWLIPESSVCP